MRPPPPQLLVLVLALLLVNSAAAFKREEFRFCADTPFCTHARAHSPHALPQFSLHQISKSESSFKANLITANSTNDEIQPRPLVLTVTAHPAGALRLQIDEDYSSEPSLHRRYRVDDVLLPDLDTYALRPDVTGDVTILPLPHGFTAQLHHHPFKLTVAGPAGRPVLSLNSQGLFEFQQLKAQKDEGEDWTERFRSHTDARPNGPQAISFDVTFDAARYVYGLPQHASPSLPLRPTAGAEPYRLFNLDVFEYEHDSTFGIYGSVPFVVAHGPAATTGFLWLNSAEMLVDVRPTTGAGGVETLWMAEAGVVDVWVFVGPGPKDVMRQYAAVAGGSAMPAEFAVGYHQCRWNYRDEEDVFGVDEGFDRHDIPYDVIWLDIEHADGKRYLTWDRAAFPRPAEMQNRLGAKGRRLVTIVDPHVKRDDNYFLHREATDLGYYVKDVHGKDFDGWCWSGSSSWLDVLDPKIREWWEDKLSLENYVGSTQWLHVWNDMNEPSVFNGPELTMPRDLLHYGGVEHREVHNVFGYYYHMATANGLLKRSNYKERPFVLSRAFFVGSQRVGAIWTGDNTADWNHLKVSVPMVLNLGLAGISFSGADIGGFFGNPGRDLLVRWYQLGAYYPFSRAHAHHDSKRREPWLMGDRATALIREALQIRYSLLPYYYTLFREANTSGIPVMRPLWMEFPSDEETYNNGEAFLIGPSLLVQGVYEQNQKSLSVYLPGGQSWYNLRSGATYKGGVTYKMEASEDYIPSFQRAGSIIPRKYRVRRSTTQMVNDPYTLVVALNGSLAAEGELYIDDGRGFDFLQGAYIHRKFIFADKKLKSVDIHPSQSSGKFKTDCLVERIILLGLPAGPKKAVVQPGNYEVDIELGPLNLLGGPNAMALTIRKPNVRIADDWTLKLL